AQPRAAPARGRAAVAVPQDRRQGDAQADAGRSGGAPRARPSWPLSAAAGPGRFRVQCPAAARTRPNRPLSRLAFLNHWKTRIVFWCGAIAVGLVAVGFAQACTWAIDEHARLIAHWPYLAPLVTPLGLVLVVWATRSLSPGARGSGIPQAIAALDQPDAGARSGLLSLRIALAKIALTVLGLLSGASVGREGPTVHVGASIMDALGRIAHFPYDYVRRSLV